MYERVDHVYEQSLTLLVGGRLDVDFDRGFGLEFRGVGARICRRLSTAFQKSVGTSEMLYVAGGLEGRERPSKGLQRKDAPKGAS